MTSDPQTLVMESMPGPEVTINGKRYHYFAGTGYFQLHSHPEIVKAASDTTLTLGIGSATSRKMAGTTPLLLELESAVSRYFGSEDSVYLPSGYLSNLAGFKALDELGLYDVIFMDEESHTSNMEGALATGKPVFQFSSRNVEDLRKRLSSELSGKQKPLIATDGVFPVHAKLPPLRSYLELAEQYDGLVWVDDAHGVGILGRNGRGTCEYLDIKSPRLFMGASLSKAFGAYGGIIPGNRKFIEQVRKGSVMSGSTSPMNAAVAAGIKGLDLVTQDPGMREKLWENARCLKTGLESIHIPTEDNNLPIVAFSTGSARSMKLLQRVLMDEGFFIQYTRYKGAGKEGLLRIVVFSTHSGDQIDQLISSLDRNLPRITRK